MINLATGAKVRCIDGTAGTCTAVIMNPVSNAVSSIVVEDRHASPQPVERMVPLTLITASSKDEIQLAVDLAAFGALDPFVSVHYVKSETPPMEGGMVYQEPWLTLEQTDVTTFEEEHIAPGELAVRRGSHVDATDGHVGRVSHLIVDAATGGVTHLVLESGHMWGKKQVALPVSAIESVDGKTVTLKLSQEEIGSLPVVNARSGTAALDVQLLVWSFDNTAAADEALKELKQLVDGKEIEILNAAVLTKDADGKTQLKETQDVSGGRGALFGAIAGGVIGLLGGPVGAVVGAAAGAATGGVAASLIDMGFNDDDLKTLQASMSPGSSALVAVLENTGVERALEALGNRGGQLLRQSISDEVVAEILARKTAESTPSDDAPADA